jgi:hypothetical protein
MKRLARRSDAGRHPKLLACVVAVASFSAEAICYHHRVRGSSVSNLEKHGKNVQGEKSMREAHTEINGLAVFLTAHTFQLKRQSCSIKTRFKAPLHQHSAFDDQTAMHQVTSST